MPMTIPGGIKEIELSGLRSIKHEKLQMNNLNIFIGANGSGKTNFISFFQMLRFYLSSNNGLDEYVGRSGGSNYLLHFGSKVTDTIRSRLTILSDTGENEYGVELGMGLGDSLFFKNETVCYSQFGRTNKNTPVPLGGGVKTSRLLQIGADDAEYGKYYKTISTILFFLNKMRFYQFHDTTQEARIRKTSLTEDNSYLYSDAGNLSAFLYMLKGKEPKAFTFIVEIIKQIAPYIDDIILEPEYYSSNIKLKWRENFQREYSFDAGQMSDGTLRSIALVTALAQPKLPSVICIDEPELGLHPEAISVLADLIKRASEKCQVLVATQSPTLIDYFEPEDVIVVNKTHGESHFERLEYEKYKAWLDEYSLSDVWNTNIFGGRPQR